MYTFKKSLNTAIDSTSNTIHNAAGALHVASASLADARPDKLSSEAYHKHLYELAYSLGEATAYLTAIGKRTSRVAFWRGQIQRLTLRMSDHCGINNYPGSEVHKEQAKLAKELMEYAEKLYSEADKIRELRKAI